MDDRTVMLFCAPLPPLQLRTDVPVSIGRDRGCEFPLRKNDVSRRHAEIRFQGGRFVLHDLGSTNGMMVNGNAVRAADLKSGDRFQLGEHLFQFVLEKRKREPRTYVLPDE